MSARRSTYPITRKLIVIFLRLKEACFGEGRLYLIFEWMDMDLKKFMDSAASPLRMTTVKVHLHYLKS